MWRWKMWPLQHQNGLTDVRIYFFYVIWYETNMSVPTFLLTVNGQMHIDSCFLAPLFLNFLIVNQIVLGKCGRCNIGDKYVCKDGPVFRFDELDVLPDEY